MSQPTITRATHELAEEAQAAAQQAFTYVNMISPGYEGENSDACREAQKHLAAAFRALEPLRSTVGSM